MKGRKYDDLGLYFGPDRQLSRSDDSEDDIFDAACQWILGLSGALLVFSTIYLFWG